MNLTAWTKKRRLVPRWRSLASTLSGRELASVGSTTTISNYASPEMVKRLERWRLAPKLDTAAELVEIAIIAGRERDAVSAATQLVAHETNAAPLIREQAAELLVRQGHKDLVPSGILQERASDMASWRYFTRIHPRDALAWVELALHQTISGRKKAAERSMVVALQLAPNNRHVLRSASRLFLHLDDPERAHDVIVKNVATRHDPWLLSAEIVLAELAERKSRFFKIGLQFVEAGGIAPRQITELAGAIGTADLVGGGIKRSKRMFRTSMRDPTASALAQAEWATPHLGAEIVSVGQLKSVLEAYEAVAFHLYRARQYNHVPSVCKDWARVDPYSLRPFEFGACTAAFVEDFSAAEALAAEGLRRRPGSPLLSNMKAFALASMGRLSEADEILIHIRSSPTIEEAVYFTAANRGLVAFRNGDLERGCQLYTEAVEGFHRLNMPLLSAQAQVFFAREAFLAKHPAATNLLSKAQKSVESFKNTETWIMLQRVEALMGASTVPR